MNKNIITKFVVMAGVALMALSCQTDYFNEHYLPGYNNNDEITDVREINLTLSDDDYSTIAKNATNVAIAKEAGEEAEAALTAIGKNKYFASQDDAGTYLPAFINAKYPVYDNGSVALINYTLALNVPEDVVLMNSATEYTLTEEDYKIIWGSEEEYENALTPKTVNKLKSVIPVSDDAREGEYVVVTYNYSDEEPSADEPTDEPSTPEQPAEYTSVLGTAAKDDVVEVRGYISALSTQGPILTDNGGSILLYKTSGYEIGDVVELTGAISSYNTGFQIGTTGLTIEKTGTTTVAYPQPVALDGAAMDNILTTRTEDCYAQFVVFEGTPSISEKGYINIAMDGAETAEGSIYGASDEVKALFTAGEKTTVYGYLVSVSSGRYLNVIVVSVGEAPAIDAGNAYTSVLGSAAKGDVVEVNGYISALSTQGPILTDNGGSVLIYKAANLGLAVGDEVTVSGPIGSYNCGFQIDYSKGDVTVEKTGTTTVKYPTPMDITGAAADNLLVERTYDDYAFYAKMSGQVVVSGNYFNFTIDGAEKAEGSVYGATDEVKAMLTDGLECTLYGYFCSISKYGDPKEPKFINMVVTSVEPASAPAAQKFAVKSEKRYAYFKFNGTSYEATNIVAIQPADYTAMGQNYGNFTNPDQDYYIPTFLNQTYPYAKVDDKMYVGYRCYANATNTWKVDEYVFNGSWEKTIYFTERTDQFRKTEGEWKIDRTLELNFPNGDAAGKAFYQYCVNWVYDFKDVPMGAPARDNAGDILSTDIVMIDGNKPAGNYWVSNYGNNEFYTGSSAYYGNVDWRVSAVKGGFAAAGMGNLSDDEIQAKLKENTAEVYAAVLGYVYPEMTPEEYQKVVITVYIYGLNKNCSFSFNVVEQGVFAYIEDSFIEL